MVLKRVLIIAYYFPPIGGSGTQRPVKFVKYLPEFSWQPFVISTDQPYGSGGESKDKTLMADIPLDVQVWRISTPQPKPVKQLAHLLRWQPAKTATPSTLPASKNAVTEPSISWLTRFRRLLLSPLHMIAQPPVDPALYWALRIVPLARRLIQQENIDLIVTTVPPWSALLTGSILQRLTGKPWIADFRDPWTDNTFVYFPTHLQRWVDQQLERSLIRQADAIISVTQPWLDGLRSKAINQNKPFVLIPNGWDQDDFSQLPTIGSVSPPSSSSDARIVLRHTGSAYRGEPLPLLRVLEQLDPLIRHRLCFHLIGYIHPHDLAEIKNSPYADCFLFDHKRVSHPEALRLMRESHVLLLLLSRKGPNASSGKIFEYMVSGRPILAIGHLNGVAAELVHSSGTGYVTDHNDIDDLANILHQIVIDYRKFVGKYYRPDWSVIKTYERRTLTKKLADTLDQVYNSK